MTPTDKYLDIQVSYTRHMPRASGQWWAQRLWRLASHYSSSLCCRCDKPKRQVWRRASGKRAHPPPGHVSPQTPLLEREKANMWLPKFPVCSLALAVPTKTPRACGRGSPGPSRSWKEKCAKQRGSTWDWAASCQGPWPACWL